jgi:outer membrane receptor protein involved in Fe transport
MMKIKNQAYLVASSTLLFLASHSNAALEEVVVTATKRAETIQDVPVSVTAVSADMMEKVGIGRHGRSSLAVVPNFEINSAAVVPNLYIRGLGGGLTHSIEQSVGRFVDDVYISRAAINLHPFMDVASVEVLRGPQGTLFGKNTAAGALIIHTNDPTEEFEAGLNLSHGQYATTGGVTEVNGFLSGGLSILFPVDWLSCTKIKKAFMKTRPTGLMVLSVKIWA